MTTRSGREIAGVKVSLDTSSSSLKKAGVAALDKGLDTLVFGSVRLAAQEVMEYFTPDKRVVSKWKELRAAGEERTKPIDAALTAATVVDAAKAKTGGVLVVEGVNAPKVGAALGAIEKVEEAKSVGQMLSDIVLLGVAWKSIEIDDKLDLAEKSHEAYMHDLKNAATLTFSIMHGKKPLSMADALEYGQKAFPEVSPDHLKGLVRKMESDCIKMSSQEPPGIDVSSFRKRKEERDVGEGLTRAAGHSAPSV